MFKEAPNPNQKKSPVEAGFKSAEKIYQTIELLEDLKSSEDHNQEWIDKYSDNPTAFFNEKNFAELKNISPARRLLLLANASGYLVNSPEMVSKYYVEFPEDLDVVISIFIDNQGRSKDAGEFFLFSISAKEITFISPISMLWFSSADNTERTFFTLIIFRLTKDFTS